MYYNSNQESNKIGNKVEDAGKWAKWLGLKA
jgi:hypothetical protein